MQKGSPREATSKTGEAGQTQVLILAGIVILIALAGGMFFLGRTTAPKPQTQIPVATSSPQPSPTSPVDETKNWKEYTHPEFTFKYPSSWYPENNPEYQEGNNVGFFMVGTKADHGYGDHKGNDVFAFELSDDERSLDELKKDYYPTATELTISGKSTLRTFFNLFIIKISTTKKLNIVGGTPEGKKYIDEILSTFRFD